MVYSSTNKLFSIFSRENYDSWVIQTKTYFISQELWEIIENGQIVTSSSTPNEKEIKKLKGGKEKRCKFLILHSNGIGGINFS